MRGVKPIKTRRKGSAQIQSEMKERTRPAEIDEITGKRDTTPSK
jgi:hypothetical protein